MGGESLVHEEESTTDTCTEYQTRSVRRGCQDCWGWESIARWKGSGAMWEGKSLPPNAAILCQGPHTSDGQAYCQLGLKWPHGIQDSWTLWPSNLRPLCTQPGLFMETSAPAGEGSSLGLQKSTENPSSSFRALGRWHDRLHSQTRKLRLRKMAHPVLSNGDREDYWGAWTPAREGWPGPGAHGVVQAIFHPWIGHNFSSSWTSKTISLC